MALSEILLKIIVCPQCKGDLEQVDAGSALACRACRLKYPVRDDVPIMLIDEAEKIEEQ